jgi:hypothetical protein
MVNNESYYVLQVGDKPVGQNRHYTFELAKTEAERLWYKHKQRVTFYHVVGVLDYPVNVAPELVMLTPKDQDNSNANSNATLKPKSGVEALVFEILEYFDVNAMPWEELKTIPPSPNYISRSRREQNGLNYYTFEKSNLPVSMFLIKTLDKNIDKQDTLYNELLSRSVADKELTMVQLYDILEQRNDKGEDHLYLLDEYIAQKETNKDK